MERKPLPLIYRKEARSKTQYHSPWGFSETQRLQNVFEQEERDDEIRGHTERELRESGRKLKQRLDAEKKAAERAQLGE